MFWVSSRCRRRDEVRLEATDAADRYRVEGRREEDDKNNCDGRLDSGQHHPDDAPHHRECQGHDRRELWALPERHHDEHRPARKRESGKEVNRNKKPYACPRPELGMPDPSQDEPAWEIGQGEAGMPGAIARVRRRWHGEIG